MDQNSFRADVAAAIKCMREGGVILYPTDTVWGIGCDATRSDAVRRVFEIKRRAEAKALITLVDSVGMLCRFVDDPPEVALELAELSTTPCTIVYDHPRGLAPELLAPERNLRNSWTLAGLARLPRRECRTFPGRGIRRRGLRKSTAV